MDSLARQYHNYKNKELRKRRENRIRRVMLVHSAALERRQQTMKVTMPKCLFLEKKDE